jgi:periplasmic protein CpxP/Spy
MNPNVNPAIDAELKRFAKDLNLTEDQKAKFQAAMQKANAKLTEMEQSGKTVDPAIARQNIRSFVTGVLTPEQLTKWDAEMAKSKNFLGHPMPA